MSNQAKMILKKDLTLYESVVRQKLHGRIVKISNNTHVWVPACGGTSPSNYTAGKLRQIAQILDDASKRSEADV